MDFFEHQEVARRKSHVLILYFAFALVGIVAAVYGLAIGMASFLDDPPAKVVRLWNPQIFLYSAGGTAVLVFLASSFKTLQLSGGGAVVARELGGRELDRNTTDFHERRLLNLVEEMAIAAGVPVPAVYVMDAEESINAFAAGKTPSDAVIGVTRGAMTLLNRDELQGVIAHEFSHILNGDMRLNLRLMGLLFGILFLALIGEFMLRNAFRGVGSSNRKEGASLALVVLLAGIGLMIIGYVGAFFANLIKASVSRQREFLADASAVQFTRNPDGIAGALKKIAGLSAGSRLAHPMARDASHLFFGNALGTSLFATHPPLAERIRRLLPHWDGRVPATPTIPVAAGKERRRAAPVGSSAFDVRAQATPLLLQPEEAHESLRTVHPEQVELGQLLHAQFPPAWVEACRSPSGAQGLVFALHLAQDQRLRREELVRLRQIAGEEMARDAEAFSRELASVHSAVKIGLIDLCIPTLRHLSLGEYERFRGQLHELIASDGQVDLFEFMLLRLVTRHLDYHFFHKSPDPIRFHRLQPVKQEVGVVLSTLAAMSHPDDGAATERAFVQAAAHLSKAYLVEIPRQGPEACGLREIGSALDRLAQASPALKKRLIEACSLSVMEDGALSSREAELIRAVADSIGCPIPPFVRAARLS